MTTVKSLAIRVTEDDMKDPAKAAEIARQLLDLVRQLTTAVTELQQAG